MKAITYKIKLLEPALVSKMAGDPNAAVAFDYIPGSVLRGVFVGQYLKPHPGVDVASDDEARRWFFTGETRWLNAYPIDRRSRQRSLPVPRSIHRDKNGDENEVFDLAIHEPQDDHQQLKTLGKPFCRFIEDRKIRLIEPQRQISVHTARTRRHGRARSAEQDLNMAKGDTQGGIYLYDALADGEEFGAVVLCADEDADKIKAMLDEAATSAVKVGKSLTGGYGKAKIEEVSNPQANWREYAWPEFLAAGDAAAHTSSPDRLVITLLSDVFLRDEATGQYVVEEEAIASLLEKELGGDLESQRHFIGQNILGGFNRKWGLPLPQAHAFAAGSVMVFKASGVSPQKIITLLEKGIGERRAEGFGRLAINWQSEAELKKEDEERIRKQERENYTPKNISLAEGTPESRFAERVANRILRQRLERRVTAAANVTWLTPNAPMPVSKSQISRLRGLAQEELMKPESERDLGRVVKFIEGLKDRKTTDRQFRSARVGDKRLDEWLIENLGKTEDDQWQGMLGLERTKISVSIGGVIVRPTEQMKREYLLRWLTAFLTRLAKQKRKE